MDVYDKAVRYLKRRPEFIFIAWENGFDSKTSLINLDIPGISVEMMFVCSRLFQGISKSGDCDIVERGGVQMQCGCLTQIVGKPAGWYVAQTKKLTDAIRKDERIPKNPRDIKPKDLKVFAEWQRRADKELKRIPYQV